PRACRDGRSAVGDRVASRRRSPAGRQQKHGDQSQASRVHCPSSSVRSGAGEDNPSAAPFLYIGPAPGPSFSRGTEAGGLLAELPVRLQNGRGNGPNVRRLWRGQMHRPLAAYIGFLFLTSPAAVFGQASVTQRVAASDPIYLIIRTDDVGMSHSVNMAVQRLIETGLPLSVSVMFACPWYQEAAEILKR